MCKFKGETNHHQMRRHWLKSYCKYDKPTSTLGGILQHPVHILDGAGASLRWARATLQMRWQSSLQSLESFRTSQPWLCVNSHFKAIIFPKETLCLQNASSPHIRCRSRKTQEHKERADGAAQWCSRGPPDPPDRTRRIASGLRVQRQGNSSARITASWEVKHWLDSWWMK